MLRSFLLLCSAVISLNIQAQSTDSTSTPISPDTLGTQRKDVQIYSLPEETFIYTKPKPFQFLTQQPKTFAHAVRATFRKKSIPALVVIAASTAALIAVDQKITNGVEQFYRYIHVSTEREYKTVIGFDLGQHVDVYEAPLNFNSFIYSLGEGSTSVFVAGGLSLYGHIKNDYRARQTSSQLMQSLIAMGITTQILKRVTGRESPFTASKPGGAWRPFPGFADYQNNVPMHDAFPSGHLATVMATVTVLADNYPEKKWIKPVGYSVVGLVGTAMVGNGVHWVGDYPLAIGLGYVFGKVAVKMNRTIQKKFERR